MVRSMSTAGSWCGVLGACLIAVGCTPQVQSPSAGSTGESVSTTLGQSTSVATGATSSTTMVTGMDDSSSSAGSTNSSTGGSTSLDSGTSESGSDTTTGPAPPTACESGCSVEVACTDDWVSERECVGACEANLMKAAEFERACEAAWEDLHACLGTLSCEELAEWMRPVRFPYPCLSEDEVLMFECAGQ